MTRPRRQVFPTLWGPTKPETFFKTAALLQQLNTTPVPPAENSIEDFAAPLSDRGERLMTIKQERDLVGYLSFLVASTDDPKKVTAVCVEENGAGTGMAVRLAVNSGDLRVVKEGLEGIAEVLVQAANESIFCTVIAIGFKLTLVFTVDRENFEAAESTSRLLQRIVVMNRGRILSRIRSRHGKSRRARGKPQIVPRLVAALRSSESGALPTISTDGLTTLQGHIKELEGIYESIEELSIPPAIPPDKAELLTELVKCASNINSQPGLDIVLKSLPGMQQSERESLHKCIVKLGRYYSASTWLIRAARTLSTFKNIRIETIRPPPQKAPIDNSMVSIGTLLDSLFPTLPSGQKQAMRNSTYTILKKRPTDADAALSETLSKNYRVHSEIQLLIYYALNEDPEVPRPRVICASKNACFLCNLFLKFDGQFYTHRSHGRLYEKWTMPDINPVSSALAERCGVVLGKIQDVLVEEIRKTLRGGRLVMSHPNESALVPSTRWPSPGPLVVEPQGSVFKKVITEDAPRDDVVVDSVANTPGVSPLLLSNQNYRFSEASSRTSVGIPAAAPPERAPQPAVSVAEPVAAVEVAPPLDQPLGVPSHPPLDTPSRSRPETALQTARDNSNILVNITSILDSSQPITDAGEPVLPRAPLSTNSPTEHGLGSQPMDHINTFFRSTSRDTRPSPDFSLYITAPEGDTGLDVTVTHPPDAHPYATQLPRPQSPPIPLAAPNALPMDTFTPPLTLEILETTTAPPTPPPAIVRPSASPPSRRMVLNLERGIEKRRELHPSNLELRIQTPHIHATVTSEMLTGQPCQVLIKYLLPDDRPRMSRQGRNIVLLEQMERGEERTAGHGAAYERTKLYLWNKEDLVEIKYDLGDIGRKTKI